MKAATNPAVVVTGMRATGVRWGRGKGVGERTGVGEEQTGVGMGVGISMDPPRNGARNVACG